MKKTNDFEDNEDDTDQLRKKKLKTDITDQMVPVPENSPLQQLEEEREELSLKNDEEMKESHLLDRKQWRSVLDPLDDLYEDVNSPEDFDSYECDKDGDVKEEPCATETAVINNVFCENDVAVELGNPGDISNTNDNNNVDCELEDEVAVKQSNSENILEINEVPCESEDYHTQETELTFEAKENPVKCDVEISGNYEAVSASENCMTENVSLQSSDDVKDCEHETYAAENCSMPSPDVDVAVNAEEPCIAEDCSLSSCDVGVTVHAQETYAAEDCSLPSSDIEVAAGALPAFVTDNCSIPSPDVNSAEATFVADNHSLSSPDVGSSQATFMAVNCSIPSSDVDSPEVTFVADNSSLPPPDVCSAQPTFMTVNCSVPSPDIDSTEATFVADSHSIPSPDVRSAQATFMADNCSIPSPAPQVTFIADSCTVPSPDVGSTQATFIADNSIPSPDVGSEQTTFIADSCPIPSPDVGSAQATFMADNAISSPDVGCAQATFIADNCSIPSPDVGSTQVTFMTDDCSPDVDMIQREIISLTETTPIVFSTASVEDVEGDAIELENGEIEEVEGDSEVVDYTFNAEEECVNDTVESAAKFVELSEERDIVPEVEDVTCDSGGDTMVMKNEVFSKECEVSKPNLHSAVEMTYANQLNNIERVDEMIFHTRSTVIETGNMSASLQTSDNSVMKCGNSHFICGLPPRENVGVVRYCDGYGEMSVSSLYPKAACDTVCISTVPKPSDRELYVYDSPVQNMMFCRNSTVIDARTLPVSSNLNGMDTYTFHRVPVESSSGIKNVNSAYGHANTGVYPVIQDSRFEYNNRDVKPVKKLPSEEEFMRSIEKNFFQSKIETKIEDTIVSKYNAELDLSLPLKKRLRTLAAISNITCTQEKCVSPKEDSFPSYPVKPMISIAELEFTKLPDFVRKPGKPYQDNYK